MCHERQICAVKESLCRGRQICLSWEGNICHQRRICVMEGDYVSRLDCAAKGEYVCHGCIVGASKDYVP